MTSVSESLSRPSASPTCSEPAGADRAQVRQPVQHRHVGHPMGARQLPGRLQPPGDAEVGQDRPGLVDDQERLADALATLAGDGRLEPGGGTGHEHAERADGVERREVEHDERAGEIEAPASSRRRTSRADRRATSRRSSSATSRPSSSRVARSVRMRAADSSIRIEQRRDDPRQGRHRRGAAAADTSARSTAARSRGASGRPRQALASEASSSVCRRVRVVGTAGGVEPPPVHRVERVEAHAPARSQRHRPNAPQLGQPRRTRPSGRPPRPGGRTPPGATGRS